MLFSIRKIHKIQALEKWADIHSSFIDWLRKPSYIEQKRWEYSLHVSTILGMQPKDELNNKIDSFFNGSKISNFLKHHPHVFADLIRVIHKNWERSKEKGWHIPDDTITEIQQVFLFRWRKEDSGVDISEFVKNIAENSDFIEYACQAEQKSILSMWSYEFDILLRKNGRFNSKTTTDIIKKIIQAWITNNVPDFSEKDFLAIKNQIFSYLGKIFGIDTNDIDWVQNMWQLAWELAKLFENGSGNDRKKAWKVIQAFHAWSDILNIESSYAERKQKISKIPEKIQSMGITLNWNISSSKNQQWVERYFVSWMYNWYPIEISWRSKEVKSILKKLWGTEDYVRWSSIRDEIGISFTFPDDFPQAEKINLIAKWSDLFAHHWYILKDKWELDNDEEMDQVTHKSSKKPLFRNRRKALDPNIINASQSGFMRLTRNWAFWTELQYCKKSVMEYKKREDIIYKIQSAIIMLMRWENQASPQELYNLLLQEIGKDQLEKMMDPETNNPLGITDHSKLMIYLIQKWILRPYIWERDGKVALLFTHSDYERKFNQEWDMTPLVNKKNRHYREMIQYINSLNS